MGSPVDSAPVPTSSAAPEGARGGTATSPIAVVWCRQVDNEAESPGYTTVPEDFPGHRETLDIIRIVGNLTVNVADTHDYWDPDPTQPLSYYPNLFLYPAYGGRYTCIGRMFLSTEDRPRLGVKTLVLDTAQLLASGEFGSTIVRWHASMGGPRRDGSRPPPIPDPGLFPLVGEGFLFHRGSTDPVLIVASDEWEATLQAILELIRVMPASLVALGAILAFPYFLPQPKTPIHEFFEQVPLSLAVMRTARGDAAGERFQKRMEAWTNTTVTVRDLTGGLPATAARGKDAVPLVLQYARDRNEAKLAPISQRVDLVEMGRLRQFLTDPEHQAGKDRRREMWRIGTAMESAGLLLQRSRGRHVSLTGDASKRAQEYVKARLPEEPESEFSTPLPPPAPAGVGADAAAGAAPHPSWLQRESGPAVPPPPSGIESVPVSVSDDPSLRPASGAVPPPPPPPGNGTASPSPSGVDLALLKQEVERDMARLVEERVVALSSEAARDAAQALERRFAEQVDRQISTRLADLRPQYALDIRETLDAQDQKQSERLAQLKASDAAALDQLARDLRAALDRRLGEVVEIQKRVVSAMTNEFGQRIDAAETRQQTALNDKVATLKPLIRDELASTASAQIERSIESTMGSRFDAAIARVEEASRVAAGRVEAKIAEQTARQVAAIDHSIRAREEETRAALAAQVELHLAEASEREKGLRQELERTMEKALARQLLDTESRRAKELKDLEGRLGLLVDGRQREIQDKTKTLVEEKVRDLRSSVEGRDQGMEARITSQFEAKVGELKESQLHSSAELQVRMQSYFEQKLREAQDREREKYLELLARLKSELDAAIPRILESPRFEAAIREQVQGAAASLRAESQRHFDERLAEAETRLRSDATESTRRVEAVETALEDRNKELVRLEQSLKTDLDDLDRRTEILSDRLVPAVRKTWMRIGELEKTQPGAPDTELRYSGLKREIHHEIRRLESELAERTQEIRDRMETSIANQGKVWLTLIRQLSQLTEDRRAAESLRPTEFVRPRVNPMAPQAPVEPEADGLEEVRELLEPRPRRPTRGERPAPRPAREPDDLDLDDEDEEPEPPRRTRRPGAR